MLDMFFGEGIGLGGVTTYQDYYTHFELSQSMVGAKAGDSEKRHLTTRKQNFACLACSERDWNPQVLRCLEGI